MFGVCQGVCRGCLGCVRGCWGVFRVCLVSETAQVELIKWTSVSPCLQRVTAQRLEHLPPQAVAAAVPRVQPDRRVIEGFCVLGYRV